MLIKLSVKKLEPTVLHVSILYLELCSHEEVLHSQILDNFSSHLPEISTHTYKLQNNRIQF